jgi:hypothetical protein
MFYRHAMLLLGIAGCAGAGLRVECAEAPPVNSPYVNTGCARDSFEIVVPIDPDQDGERRIYPAGMFEAYQDGETTKHRGSPRYRCPSRHSEFDEG